SEAEAEAEFENTARLAGLLSSKQFRIPHAVARPGSEPRLVLLDFDPWLSLGEYFADRGTTEVICRSVERLGQTLATLHRSSVSLPRAGSEMAAKRTRLIAACPAELAMRFHAIAECAKQRLASLPRQEPVPVHGA